jgi:hypothetical protein
MIENGEAMTGKRNTAQRPGVTDERHPIGRHVFSLMKKSAHRSSVIASMQLDWSGVNHLFTQISAAFLYAQNKSGYLLDQHVNNIIDVYMNYMQTHPGTMGRSIDRLNLILFYLYDHMATDWYRLKFQGSRVSSSLPGDILVDQGVSHDWCSKNGISNKKMKSPIVDIQTLSKDAVIKYVSEQEIELGRRTSLTPEDREAFMDILLPETWKRYRENFGEPEPNLNVEMAFLDSSLPLTTDKH